MKKITDQEIARIFAKYLGCQVEVKEHLEDGESGGCNFTTEMLGIQRKNQNWLPLEYSVIVKEDKHELAFELKECKLILKPLSEISDADAIEIGNIFNSEYDWIIKSRTSFGVLTQCSDYNIYIWLNNPKGDIIDCEERHVDCDEPCSNHVIVDMIDTLREMGYALPYQGESLFGLGIAIQKT